MICVQFMFEPGEYDEEFTTLDNSIDEYAKSLPGYVGVDRWYQPASDTQGARQNSLYYFTDRETVRDFAKFEDHLEAKQKVSRWYRAYHVVVSEVSGSYGDSNFERGQLP